MIVSSSIIQPSARSSTIKPLLQRYTSSFQAMDSGADASWKRTLLKLLSPLVFTRLFWSKDVDHDDIEAQSDPRLLTSPGPPAQKQNLRNSTIIPEPRTIPSTAGKGENCSHHSHESVLSVQEDMHCEDAHEPDCIDMRISKELLWEVQHVIDCDQELQLHQQQYDNLERAILQTEALLSNAEQGAAETYGEDDVQQEVDRLSCQLKESMQQRDILSSRLKIFKSNVNYAKDDCQASLQNLFNEAGLLNIPTTDMQATDDTSPTDPRLNSESTQNRDQVPPAEENPRHEMLKKLTAASQEVAETQDLFDNMQAKYAADEAAYEECIACGQDDTTRSEFDRMFVQYQMDVTTYLINAEKTYEDQRAEAIAQGVIASNWGTPSEYDCGSSCAPSSPEMEVVRAGSRDYAYVYAWMEEVPDRQQDAISELVYIVDWSARFAEVDRDANTVHEPIDVDHWEAEEVEMSDSISVVVEAQCNPRSKDVRRWQEMIGHR